MGGGGIACVRGTHRRGGHEGKGGGGDPAACPPHPFLPTHHTPHTRLTPHAPAQCYMARRTQGRRPQRRCHQHGPRGIVSSGPEVSTPRGGPWRETRGCHGAAGPRCWPWGEWHAGCLRQRGSVATVASAGQRHAGQDWVGVPEGREVQAGHTNTLWHSAKSQCTGGAQEHRQQQQQVQQQNQHQQRQRQCQHQRQHQRQQQRHRHRHQH